MKLTRELVVGIIDYLADVCLYTSFGITISYLVTHATTLIWPMAGVYATALALRFIAKRGERKLKGRTETVTEVKQ